MAPPNVLVAHKATIRDKVWAPLREVAIPDSRFHYDFSSFIADFQGSSSATALFMQHSAFTSSRTIFITPDNCLTELRLRALRAGKLVLVTTYGILRGFWLLDPKVIPEDRWEIASLLDGMESLARHVTLAELKAGAVGKVDCMVTGTGAINHQGIRFGKGHGFFDLEWGMLSTIGIIDQKTATVALVHDCQVLDEELHPEVFDTVCDLVVTPTRVIEVSNAAKPSCGIIWDKLAEGMLEGIPPLAELKTMVSA